MLSLPRLYPDRPRSRLDIGGGRSVAKAPSVPVPACSQYRLTPSSVRIVGTLFRLLRCHCFTPAPSAIQLLTRSTTAAKFSCGELSITSY